MNVGIVGLGNIGLSIGRGLAPLKGGYAVRGCDKNADRRLAFSRSTGFEADDTSERLLSSSSVILLCIRTNQVEEWVRDHAALFDGGQTVVCLSPGVPIAKLAGLFGVQRPQLFRAISNINVATRAGLTLMLDRSALVSPEPKAAVDTLFRDLGEVVTIQQEEQLDALSVLPGCAPAVVAILVEGLRTFGERVGFDTPSALQISLQCAAATVESIRQQNIGPETLKRSVASRGGVVERLLDAQESSDLRAATVAWLEVVMHHLANSPRK